MPAERRRSSRQLERLNNVNALDQARMYAIDDEVELDLESAPSPSMVQDSLGLGTPPPQASTSEQPSQDRRRVSHSRKKPLNHIPRPPNAFIMFRSGFVKSRHVSTGVETNHSTLSKIIGMTWQNLPEEERRIWHAKAKLAQAEHKRQFPDYAFRPVHNKAKAAERKKIREVGPKDQKRCEKIAQLLVSGTKGEELEAAIHEFDKYHVPEIVTRFDTPITASTFTSTPSASKERGSAAPVPAAQPVAPAPPKRASRSSPPRPTILIPTASPTKEAFQAPPTAPYYRDSIYKTDYSPSFEFDTFAFNIGHHSPMLTNDNYAQAVSPMDHTFDNTPHQDTSLLCARQDYPSQEEWTRQSSPLSNSTSSIPNTPAHMSIPFPEPYSTFTSDATSDYASIADAQSYTDYSNYVYPSMPEPTYSGIKDSERVPSGFNAYQPEVIHPTPMLRNNLDYSSLMDSLTSYSL